MTSPLECVLAASACLPATNELRRFHGGCHHGPDGWQRLSQNYMRTTCLTRRVLLSTGLEDCGAVSGRVSLDGRCV